MSTYMAFEIRRALRNKRFLILSVALPVVLYELIGQQQSGPVGGVAFKNYFMISMAAYGAVIAALSVGGPRVAAERANGWVRQLRVTPLSQRDYLAGKVMTSVCLVLPAIVLVCAAGALNGVSLSAGAWVQLLVSLVIASVPFALLGLAVGYWLDAESAQAGTAVIMLGTSVLGGLWYPLTNFPRVLQLFGEALPTYRLASLARSALEGAAPGGVDMGVMLAWTVAFGACFAWLYRRDTDRVRV
jgi:ABC-2 type transport system permease protein